MSGATSGRPLRRRSARISLRSSGCRSRLPL